MTLNQFGSKESIRIVSRVTFRKEVGTRDLAKTNKQTKGPGLLIADLHSII